MIEILEYTGNWFLKSKFFGGYDVMVEVRACYECEHDFTTSPEFTAYIKANKKQLLEAGIRFI